MATINKNQIIKGSLEHLCLFWEGIVQTGIVGMEVTSISSDNKMTHRRLRVHKVWILYPWRLIRAWVAADCLPS